jgi:Bacterial Ig-like domain
MARGVMAACLLLVFQSPAIRFDSARNVFVLENWTGASQLTPDRYAEVFSVSVDAPDVPAMLGQYRLERGALVFEPQFPVQPGVSYRAVARIPGMSPISSRVDIPKKDVKPTTVVDHVYPSTNVLPENQLKFYIHFSRPMARGFAYEHVFLLDEFGKRITVPFLELTEELWDPEARRFTLFFDPGRIKRGLVSQQELGMALQEGKRYTLVIDKGWLDEDGNPLAADFRKTFSVGPADRKPIDLKAWSVRKPVSGTRQAVTVVFPEPLDHAILQRELDIVDTSGSVVRGSVSIGPDEKSWIFTPESAWKKGSYSIEVGTSVADLAGNMVDRPFEIDVFEKVDKSLTRTTRTIRFNID